MVKGVGKKFMRDAQHRKDGNGPVAAGSISGFTHIYIPPCLELEVERGEL